MNLSKKKIGLIIFSYIEASLEQFDSISINDIAATFGLHRSTASNYMSPYRELKPSNVRYVLSGPTSHYQKGFSFERVVLEGSATHYLSCVDDLFGSDVLKRFEARLKDLAL